ncbi:general transcriptional corepressor trfA-like isoform X2 [Corticium candelabrum]|uniref:general transcriptional corepressor trfA-like isoform X2 n=1 Tax=Corticium candelabrum TaxID=121492 RepID=UPI002E263640|nr:general transcriptional corepressor trfA-like isoform X2 [Corticium candelabrum]
MSSSASGQKKRGPVCMAALPKTTETTSEHGTFAATKPSHSSANDSTSSRKKAPVRESRSPSRRQRASPAPQRKSPRLTKRTKTGAAEHAPHDDAILNGRFTAETKRTGKRESAGREVDIANHETKSDKKESQPTCNDKTNEAAKSVYPCLVYTRDELMKLRKNEISKRKHADLDERYFVGNKWNPDLWHQSFGSGASDKQQKKSESDVSKFEDQKRGHQEDNEESSNHHHHNNNDSSVDLRPHMGKSHAFRSTHRTGYENDTRLEWRKGKQSVESDGWESKRNVRKDVDDADWQLDNKRRPRLNSYSKPLDLHQHKEWSDEEEPEWMTHGPTSQLEFIELRGFDDEDERRQMVDSKEEKKIEDKHKRQENKKNREKEIELRMKDGAETSRTAMTETSRFDFNDFLKSATMFANTEEPPTDTSVNSGRNSSRFQQYFSMSEQSKGYGDPLANRVPSSHTNHKELAPGVAALFQSANCSAREIPLLALTEDEFRQSSKEVDPAVLQMFNEMDVAGNVKQNENMVSEEQMSNMRERHTVLHEEEELQGSPTGDGEVETRAENKMSPQPRVPVAFLPTAVIRKMHNDGQLQSGLVNDKIKSASHQTKTSNSPSPTSLSNLSSSAQFRVLQEHQMRQQELLWQQQRARQQFIRQRQILHEQQIGRQRELQRQALLEAEMRRRQAQLLTLRKFAIDRGLPLDMDPHLVYQLFQQYHVKMRALQLRQMQQQQQQRNQLPANGTGLSRYASQATAAAQQMGRIGSRVLGSGQSAAIPGAVGREHHVKIADQTSGMTSPGRTSPVSFTGTPPPSLRPIPHHPRVTYEQLLAAQRPRLIQQQMTDPDYPPAGGLAKWLAQQPAPNSIDSAKTLDQMLSVEELEQKQTD